MFLQFGSIVAMSLFLKIIFLKMHFCQGTAGGNWTLEDIQKYRKNVTLHKMAIQNCTTFYNLEETTKFLNECTIALGKNHSLRVVQVRRSIQTPLISDDPFITNELRGKRQVIGEKEFLPSGLRIRVNNPWRIMETKVILENPCIGHCLLQKLLIIDENGDPQRDVTIDRVLSVLEAAKGTREDAIGIVDPCFQRFRKRREKILNSNDSASSKITEKCKNASRMGICLPRETFTTCRDAFVGSATSRRQTPKRPKSTQKPTTVKYE